MVRLVKVFISHRIIILIAVRTVQLIVVFLLLVPGIRVVVHQLAWDVNIVIIIVAVHVVVLLVAHLVGKVVGVVLINKSVAPLGVVTAIIHIIS